MLTRPTARPGRADTRQDGFTLIEMLVVMSVSMLLLILVGRGFLQNYKLMAQAQSRSEITVRMQNALEVMSRDIRVADPVVSGSASTLTVTVLRASKCRQRTWTLSGTTITSSTTTYPTTTCGSGTPTTSPGAILLSNVANDASTPLFSYFDHSGAAPLTPTGIATVIVKVKSNPVGGGSVSLQAVVNVRNAS